MDEDCRVGSIQQELGKYILVGINETHPRLLQFSLPEKPKEGVNASKPQSFFKYNGHYESACMWSQITSL